MAFRRSFWLEAAEPVRDPFLGQRDQSDPDHLRDRDRACLLPGSEVRREG